MSKVYWAILILWHVWYGRGMSSTQNNSPIRARLDPPIKAQLDRFCSRTRRSITQAVNLLLAEALEQHPEAQP